MPRIESRRTATSTEVIGRLCARRPKNRERSSSGMMTSLQSMVLSATDVMITMPVAADRPPRKAIRLTVLASAAIGSEMT